MRDTGANLDLPLLLVVGEGPVSESLISMAELLGWRTLMAVSMAEVEVELSGASAVVVTSHHADVDGPAIRAALSAKMAYVAAMGSRRTQDRRREWLLDNGVSETDLERLHAPAGLDIGADSPAEIALAILAEQVATVRGATGQGSLKDRTGPLHPALAPGVATCPEG